MRGTFSAARTADRQARVGGAGAHGGVAQEAALGHWDLGSKSSRAPNSAATAKLQARTGHASRGIKFRAGRQILALFFSFSSSYLP